MKTLNKVKTLLVIAAIVVTILPLSGVANAKISKFDIWYFKPSQVSTAANYKVRIDINETVEIHGWIKLTFPPEWTMPDLPPPGVSEYYDHELERVLTSIYIGTSPCTKCQGLPIIKTNKRKNKELIDRFKVDNENSILFRTHIQLDPNGPYDPVPITIADRAGFINSPTPGLYKIQVATESEPENVSSNEIRVVKSSITPADVSLSNPAVAEVSGYNVSFKTGEGGSLDARESRITLVFPKETNFPESVASGLIKVNGSPCSIEPNIHQISGTFSFLTPVAIDNNGAVDIQISEKAGLINPAQKGDYQMRIYTSFEPDAVNSNVYKIVRAGQKPLVVPPYASQIASYKFSVEFPKSLNDNDLIEVYFPKGTTLNSFVPADSIIIDGTKCKLKPRVVAEDNKIQLYAPKKLAAGSVMIEFLKTAKIKNPDNPGQYTIKFTSQGNEGFLNTDPYPILIKKIDITTVSVKPLNAKATATWVLEGTLAYNGDLDKGETMTLTFPPKTICPSNISNASITFNGIPVLLATGSGNVLTIKTPDKVVSGGAFEVVIEPSSGIVTTEVSATDHTIKVVTSKDQTGGESEQFFIAPALPVTTLLMRPAQPNGKNGWFITPPEIDFVCTSKTATIKVWWNYKSDQAINWNPGEWSPLANAQRVDTLYWQAIDTYGTEELRSFDFKVDTITPTFTISNPIGGQSAATNKTSFIISGVADATELAMYEDPEKTVFVVPKITINGVNVPVVQPDPKGDTAKVPNAGKFEMDVQLTKEGANEFTVVAEDEAGNQNIKKVVIERDTTPPPSPTITKPALGETNNCAEVAIEGKTEPGITLTINDELVDVDVEGNFLGFYRPKTIGPNQIKLVATDTVGNKREMNYTVWYGTQAVLKIKDVIPTKNGLTGTPLAIAPYIKNGNTMVPMRYLGETLMNAKVDYITATKSVRITLTNGTIIEHKVGTKTFNKTEKGKNLVKIMMPVPSEVIKGTTFLPMRVFLQDGLGIASSNIGFVNGVITVTVPPDPAKCKK